MATLERLLRTGQVNTGNHLRIDLPAAEATKPRGAVAVIGRLFRPDISEVMGGFVQLDSIDTTTGTAKVVFLSTPEHSVPQRRKRRTPVTVELGRDCFVDPTELGAERQINNLLRFALLETQQQLSRLDEKTLQITALTTGSWQTVFWSKAADDITSQERHRLLNRMNEIQKRLTLFKPTT